jgi:membrane-bound lytic murein transglycosylase F
MTCRRPTGRALLLVLLLLGACRLEPVAPLDQATETVPVPPRPRTLDEIRASGTLRVLTRNNGNSYFVWKGRRLGFHYELAERLARDLGVDPTVVVPVRWSDLIPALLRGEGDLVAASLTVTEERRARVLFARPYATTRIHVVWGPGRDPISSLFDFSGRTFHVRPSSSYHRRLQQINAALNLGGRLPAEVVLESESRETEQILEQVHVGAFAYTLADHHIALANLGWLPDLQIGPAITPDQNLAWAVHPDAGDLAEAIDRMFEQVRREPTYNVLYRRYYEQPRTHARRQRERLRLEDTARITPWDEVLRHAGQAFGLDWRLLAAVAYQESSLDPEALSWAGACGLFQLMPETALELGVGDPTDPLQSIDAGAAYLAQLRDALVDVPLEAERTRMALAAFNCGLGHVQDARDLARSKGLDPDRWSSVARALILLSQWEYASQAPSGWVRGREPVRYVRQVWARYRAYRHDMGERDVGGTLTAMNIAGSGESNSPFVDTQSGQP